LDDAMGLTDTGADTLADARTGKNGRHRLGGLLRQSVFGPLAGYENDADRLCRDPAMRWVVGDRAITGLAASASQMGRFETAWLTRPQNLAALFDLPGRWIDTNRDWIGISTLMITGHVRLERNERTLDRLKPTLPVDSGLAVPKWR